MRVSPSPARPRPERSLRRLVVPATIAALALGTVPAAGAAGPVAPSLDPSTDNATKNVDPDLVVPTDTVVEEPDPGFTGMGHAGPAGLGAGRVNGPNVLWGSLLWQYTATGPASGVRVTMVREQDGWRFSTTTDERGRWRVAVPDGTYALTAADARLPRGTWTPARAERGWLASGLETWNGGRGTGLAGVGVTPRPERSCTAPDGTVVEGTEPGGADPGAPPCPYPAAGLALDGTSTVFFWGEWFGTYPETGRDGAILSYMVPPPGLYGTPSRATAATPTATAGPTRIGTPTLPRTIRLRARSGGAVAVRCPSGTACAGAFRLTAATTTTRARGATGPTLATGSVRAGRRVVLLRPTGAGRRAAARREVAVTVTWRPAGGTATVAGPARLRVTPR